MARSAYIGNSSSSRRVKGIYLGISGSSRKVVKGYIGVNGSARKFYPQYKWKRHSISSNSTLKRTVSAAKYNFRNYSAATNRWLPTSESMLRATSSGVLVLGVSWIDSLYNFNILFTHEYATSGLSVTNLWDMQNSVNIAYSAIYAFEPVYGSSEWYGDCNLYTYTSSTTTSMGSYLGDVYSSSRNAYPDNGISGSYWYVYQGEA